MNTVERKHFTKEERQKILNKSKCKCARCGISLNTASMTVEHIFPIYLGGEHDEYNMVALCWDCNRAKGSELYRVNDYYKYIDEEELPKFRQRNNEYLAIINKNDSTVMKLDYKTYKFLSESGYNMLMQMKARGVNTKKIYNTIKNMTVSVRLERARDADIPEIYKLIQYLKNNKERFNGGDLSMCESEAQIKSYIHYGDAYILKSISGSTCGAFLFAEAQSINLEFPQLNNMVENTRLKKKFVMMFGYVNVYAGMIYNDIMEDLFIYQVAGGIMPIYVNMLDKMYIEKKDIITMATKIGNKDCTLEWFTVSGLREGIKRNICNDARFENWETNKEIEDKLNDTVESLIYGEE